MPLYTPEPDIIHEVIGHGHLLATPTFGELHRLAGVAARRLRDEDNLRFLSRVFWFSLEFGVVREDGELRAYGAGILSSYGEIEEFRSMELRPLDIAAMGSADYDITAYQPLLYCADSVDEVVDGGRRVLPRLRRRLDRGAAILARGDGAMTATVRPTFEPPAADELLLPDYEEIRAVRGPALRHDDGRRRPPHRRRSLARRLPAVDLRRPPATRCATPRGWRAR